MAEKQNITQMFITMGFSKNHIGRAFTVYERNFGHSYNIEVITEIIFRLQRKDQSKKDDSDSSIPISHTSSLIPAIQHEEQKKFANMDSFVPHLTISEAKQLQVHDKLDHRDRVGRFVYGTVVDIQGTNIKIHYDGWSRKWDTWSDYNVEIHRFAYAGSVSKRPAHRFKQLQKGDYIDINPTHTHSEWKCGEIRRFDEKSGQIQVSYESLDTNVMYWAHLDNINEIAEFTSKSGAVHSTQMKIMKQTQTQIQQHSKQEGKKDGKSKDNETDVENLNKIMQSATVDIEENRDNMNENSNNRQRKSRKRKRKFDEMNEIILSPSISVKRIKLMNSNNCIDHKKENETLKQENEALKQRLDLLQCRSEKIKAMNLNQLNESKTIMQNTIVNMQNKIKLIEETEKELMDNTYKCVACTDNMKNISFVDGCDHVALCHKCEQLAETKCCPICRKPYTNVKKINF
eukprot:403561_1